MQFEVFDKIIDELSDVLFYMTFYFQGEPYLNADFLKMVKKASSKNIYTATSTNGHFLNDNTSKETISSGLNRLIISIDGATQQTYEVYRRSGNLEKVIEGTKNILKWRKQMGSSTPLIVWQFLVVKPNEHEIPEIKKLANEIGVDQLKFKSAQVYDYANGNPLIPTDVKYSRYKQQKDGKWKPKLAMTNECWRMWHSAVITWDGKVVPCCFDKDASHEMGNVSTHTFEEIWHSEGYQQFRNQLMTARDQIEICQNCTEGGKVWV